MAGHAIPAISSASTATFKIYQHDGLCLDISGEKNDAGGDCLGVAGESTSYEAQVVAWTCNGHPDQYWYPAQDGDYLAFLDYNSGLVLTVDHGSTTNGAGIVQWGWRGYDNQLWY
jgi:hypothetical protein